MHFKWKFLFVHFFYSLFNIFRIKHFCLLRRQLPCDGGIKKNTFLFFCNDNPILSCFYFPYSSRKTSWRETKWFGVEGFSIIIFCVIMITSLSHSFFWEIVYVCSQKSTLKVKFIFLYQWIRSENVFIRLGFSCMCRWMKGGWKWKCEERKKKKPR